MKFHLLNKSISEILSYWTPLSEAGASSFFQSRSYVAALLKESPTPLRLLVGEVQGQTMLLALLGEKSRLGWRSLVLNESGDESLDVIYGEYNDFLLHREAPENIRAAALAYLLKQPGFDAVIARNSVASLYQAAGQLPPSIKCDAYLKQHSWIIDLEGAMQADDMAFMDHVSANRRHQMRRSLKLYGKRGAVVVEEAQEARQRQRFWRELAQLHQQTWEARGEPGAFAHEAFGHFHERLMSEAPTHISLLRVAAGDQTIGILYNYRYGDHLYQYQAGFAYEEDNRLKPGLLVHGLAARYYAAQGVRHYDLLAGDQPYKKSLGRKAAHLVSFELAKEGAKYRLRQGGKVLRDLSRPVFAKKRQT